MLKRLAISHQVPSHHIIIGLIVKQGKTKTHFVRMINDVFTQYLIVNFEQKQLHSVHLNVCLKIEKKINKNKLNLKSSNIRINIFLLSSQVNLSCSKDIFTEQCDKKYSF